MSFYPSVSIIVSSWCRSSRPAPEAEDLKTFDDRRVHYVDIRPDHRYPDWVKYEDDPDDFSRPYFPRRPYVEKNYVKKPPAPPTAVPEKPRPPAPRVRYVEAPIPESNIDFSMFPKLNLAPRRPRIRAPHLDLSEFPEDFQFGPDASKEPKSKLDVLNAAEAARNAAKLRSRERASSNVSGQTRPLNVRRRGASDAHVPVQPSGTIYRNHAASQSTRSLDPRVRHRAGVANLREAGAAGTHNASGSVGSMYNNASAAQSAYNISRHARRPSHVTPDSAPPVPQRNQESVSVCRRNASSASSRSAHAMRRHGLLPDGTVHQEILRVLRGPHAAQLQTPSAHTRANMDIGLPVNDTKSSKEWGAMSSKVCAAATVAGHGQSAYVY